MSHHRETSYFTRTLSAADIPYLFTGGSGFGFRVSGFGFRGSGLGFRVSGFGFRVSGFGFRVSGFGVHVSGFGFRGSGFGYRTMKTYQELDVWKQAMDMVVATYKVTAEFPAQERYGLANQM